MNNRNKNILLGVLIVGVITLTIAFALLSSNLNINGQANVAATKWNIHFDNWTNITENTVDGHTNTAEYDDTKIEQTLQPNVTKIDKVNVVLHQPGDYVKYTFKIKNDGTIDGSLDHFNTTIDCEDGKNCNFLRYTVECKDEYQNDALQLGFILEKDKEVSCSLELKYKDINNQDLISKKSKVSKIAANVNNAGKNQVYEQEEVSAQISAEWRWNQSGGTLTNTSTTPETDTSTETVTLTDTDTSTDTDTDTLTETDTSTETDTDTNTDSDSGSGSDPIPDEDLFEFSNGKILGFNPNYSGSYPTNIVIPSEMDGQTVTEISDYAFSNLHLLTSVTIPDSVTTIGDNAFHNNQLTDLTLGNSITTIGDNAFQVNQLTGVTLGNKITTLGDYAFANNQLTSVTIPNSVTTIGDYAFMSNQLTDLTLGNNITTIGRSVFRNNSLKSLTIPESVTTIEEAAFWGNDMSTLTIPDNVTTIGSIAFADVNLTSLIIGNGVTTIEEGAFQNNPLTSITLGNRVKTIANFAFDSADKYAKVDNLTIPNSVTSIGKNAFYDLNIRNLTLGNSLTTIGKKAFAGNYMRTLTIPNSVTTIGEYAFSENGNLYLVTLSNNLTSIEEGVFFHNEMIDITIPNSVTSIGKKAFAENEFGTGGPLTIPNSVTSIGESAFADNALHEIYLSENLTSIGKNAFSQTYGEHVIDRILNPTGRSFDWCSIVNENASTCSLTTGQFGRISIVDSLCEGERMSDNPNWCLTNPGESLESQEFEYWNSNTTKIESGWHELTDLYGRTQEYYFEDGTAQKGWVYYNNNYYYLSKEDPDGNGYINCNLIKNMYKESDDGICYWLDATTGVATKVDHSHCE